MKVSFSLFQRVAFFLLALVVAPLLAQDTTTYCQADAILFYNCYTFVENAPTDKVGTFEQEIWSDDGQTWYGKGTFRERRHRIVLTFDTIGHHNRVEVVENASPFDTLTIKWFDWWRQPQGLYSVRYADTLQHKPIYDADWETNALKIAVKDLQSKQLVLCLHYGGSKIMDFEVPEGVDEIRLFAITPWNQHLIGQKRESVRKTKNGIIAKEKWTNQKGDCLKNKNNSCYFFRNI